ncbi:trihelix transcription factor ENAP2-like [Typha latifolia]|uniref:trihelix transcription factor ENAP2-like n=1 Tax=Typha latifolia TaxID=4733 RepID=UPI003C308B91
MELREKTTAAPPRRSPPNPAMPYRDDCWSEGATATLIEAWGDRFLEVNRGSLRQKQWEEVASAVNSRPGGATRLSRTDVQCKNRIDTLKKKYKVEKAKVEASGGTAGSLWPFFPRLHDLLGAAAPTSAKKTQSLPSPSPPLPPLALPLPNSRPAVAMPVDNSFYLRNYAAAAAAAAAEKEEGESDSSARSSGSGSSSRRKRKRKEKGEGFRELARAIERFTEVYEKVEEEKQQQMVELEKQRMEFAKGLELQRMQMFVDSQVQLEKIKRARRVDADELGYCLALPILFS